MLRIDLETADENEVVLGLVGSIAEQGVALLAAEADPWQRSGRRLVLRLDEVDHIDAQGLALLQGWSGPRLVLRGASLYVRYLLQSRGLLP